jgi:hypothetical protein
MAIPREAFVSSLCVNSLPDNYSVIGEAPSGGWSVTRKNLQSVHIFLNTALCLGGILDTSWNLMMATTQQLVFVLDLPHPTAGASQSHFIVPPTTPSRRGHRRVPSAGNKGTFVTISPGTSSDLPVFGAMLAQLFEISHNLDDDALMCLVRALCATSEDTMERVSASQSVTNVIFRHNAYLFPVTKILEVGLVNLDRIMVFWPAITAHLIEVSSHPLASLRECGLDVLTKLVHAALAFPRDPPIQSNPGLQQAILSPLRNLAKCANADAHRRQLECVHQVLDSSGEALAYAWPVVIGIINDALTITSPPPDANIVRMAFACMQMVIADFLPSVPIRCLPLLLDSLGNFGRQRCAINVSLTAVGLLWSVSDFISKHLDAIGAEYDARSNVVATNFNEKGEGYDSDGLPVRVAPDTLWSGLFSNVVDLCVDARPEVRKSASQTLYATINTHGQVFSSETWGNLTVDLLLPLLRRVQEGSERSVTETVEVEEGMMLHHSRNTAAKQWDETRVIAITGVARTLSNFLPLLPSVLGFQDAWVALLKTIQEWSDVESAEVCQASILALQELCKAQTAEEMAASAAPDKKPIGFNPAILDDIWSKVWVTWLAVASQAIKRTPPHSANLLTPLIASFISLYRHIHRSFTATHVRKLLDALHSIVSLQHPDSLVMSKVRREKCCVCWGEREREREREREEEEEDFVLWFCFVSPFLRAHFFSCGIFLSFGAHLLDHSHKTPLSRSRCPICKRPC